MTWIAGVDGCRSGWAVALRNTRTGELLVRVVAHIAEVLALPQRPEVVCVDVPIGLLEAARPGGRPCDVQARQCLRPSRSSSVFSPPVRAVLAASDYPDALARNRASSSHRLGISKQCYAIVAKIREVDSWITAARQDQVREVHPEVCFAALHGGAPVVSSKKSAEGRRERTSLLQRAWQAPVSDVLALPTPGAAFDDVLDAMAACWTAGRILDGRATVLAGDPARDERGLRMEIVR